MSENDLVYKCADAYQKGGIKAVIAEVRKHDMGIDWYRLGAEDERAKTIERVLEAADIDIEGMSPTKVKYAIFQAIKGVGDE